MSNVEQIGTTEISVLEQAKREVAHEVKQVNVKKMKVLLKQKHDAEEIVRGIDAQIADLNQQIENGTA